jgi:uncharacterized repeat protein (TIGR03803 family)
MRRYTQPSFLQFAQSVLFVAAAMLLASAIAPQLAHGQDGIAVTDHSFGDGTVSVDGQLPTGRLVLAGDGNYYGVAEIGGADAGGVVFRMAPSHQITTIHSFTESSFGHYGFYPQGLTLGKDGNLYGVTEFGGAEDMGVLFKMTLAGAETVLHTFGSAQYDGLQPVGPPTQLSNGAFYGVTYAGGTENMGAVYKITTAGKETVLHSFADGSVPNDGYYPFAQPVLGSDGNLYGTTLYGGANGDGAIYKIAPTGILAILYSFDNAGNPDDGVQPVEMVHYVDGNFYGVCAYGGASKAGMVFEVAPTGTEIARLDMPGTPIALNNDTSGDLYVSCQSGGTASDGYVVKVPFSTGNSPTSVVLHQFGDGTTINDGATPNDITIAADGSLYVVGAGGSAGDGCLTHIRLPYSILHSFSEENGDPLTILSALTQGSDGSLYGVSNSGGAHFQGTVFKVATTGNVTILHSFNASNADGESPYGGLVEGTDGNYYGTTQLGGANTQGTAFRITPAGVVKILHSFGSTSTDGRQPEGKLYLASNGKFYGTTNAGGEDGQGTIFNMTSSGTVTILHSFGTVANDGASPVSGVIKATNGLFYGTAPSGGASNEGALYIVSGSGQYNVLHSFGGADDGITPMGALVQNGDGKLDGTMSINGSSTSGGIFIERLDGLYASNASEPYVGMTSDALTLGPADTLYGTSTGDDATSFGSIYQCSNQAVVTDLHSFSDGLLPNDGVAAYGGMTFASDGSFYGTTVGGGENGNGIVYRYNPSPPVALVLLNPTSVTGGATAEGFVELSETAQHGGALIALNGSNSTISLPAAVTVPQGQSVAFFTITTKAVTTQQSFSITASAGGASQSATLTMTP